jgi:hypothetical protein
VNHCGARIPATAAGCCHVATDIGVGEPSQYRGHVGFIEVRELDPIAGEHTVVDATGRQEVHDVALSQLLERDDA